MNPPPGSPAHREHIPVRTPAPRLTRFSTPRLVAGAAIVLVGVALALWAMSARQRVNALQRDTQRLLAAQRGFERELAARDSALADRQALLDAMSGADVRVIDVGAPSARQASGKMFWNQMSGQWTFVAHNLPRAAPNRTYQLWLITRAQRKISAGVFASSASGDALVIAHYSLPNDSLAAVAVTDEPSGGSPHPTTTPVLIGTGP